MMTEFDPPISQIFTDAERESSAGSGRGSTPVRALREDGLTAGLLRAGQFPMIGNLRRGFFQSLEIAGASGR